MATSVRQRLTAETAAALTRWDGLPEGWGASDCALAIADIHVAAGLPDPASAWRGRYGTERGAKRVLGKGGMPRALRSVAQRLGWRRIPPETARVGDIGFVRTPAGPACVVAYRGMWIGRADRGFTVLPTGRVLRAWSVEP